jgi:hypothetical protein
VNGIVAARYTGDAWESGRVEQDPKHFFENCIDMFRSAYVSSIQMTLTSAIHKRDRLAATLARGGDVLRGSLLERTTFHSSGCPKCAGGEGHPQWVLNVNYPGAKTRQLSLRPEQVPQTRKALKRYRQVKETLEAISEINQYLLRLDRDEPKERKA